MPGLGRSSELIKGLLLAVALLLGVPLTACEGEPSARAGEAVESAEAAAEPVGDRSGEPIPPPDSTTQRLFSDVMEYARENDLHEEPVGQVMQKIGLQFRGKPYMAGLLDVPSKETLICRLDGFDCVTFVESALALATAVKQQDYDYETYARLMRDQRYRGGEMDGYCSRLHYFSEWIADNEARGNVRNITEEIGGEPLDKEIDFMSQHRDSYARFATNDSVFQCILDMEERLGNVSLHYIPQDRISAIYDELEAGDIIATATDIEGLDVTHTGLVYENEEGQTGLLHASTTGGVKISPDLQSYIQDNNKQIGIVVARPTPL